MKRNTFIKSLIAIPFIGKMAKDLTQGPALPVFVYDGSKGTELMQPKTIGLHSALIHLNDVKVMIHEDILQQTEKYTEYSIRCTHRHLETWRLSMRLSKEFEDSKPDYWIGMYLTMKAKKGYRDEINKKHPGKYIFLHSEEVDEWGGWVESQEIKTL